MKRRKPLRRVSLKMAVKKREYVKVRDAYLKKNPYCEVYLAEHRIAFLHGDEEVQAPLATQVHHKRGRVGSLLTDERYFLAVSDEMHKMIHGDTAWAYKKGYMLNRNKQEQEEEEL